MWIFFGELSQRFRLSPIFVFGMGRGLLALAALLGTLLPVLGEQWTEMLPFGEGGVTLIVLLIMVIAYALLPREREIEAIVAPCPLITAISDSSLDSPLARLNGKQNMQQTHFEQSSQQATQSEVQSSVSAVSKGKDNSNSLAGSRTSSSDTSLKQEDGNARTHVEKTPANNSGDISQDEVRDATKSSVSEAAEKESNHKSWFKLKVEATANTYLLSNRETEVLFFLAKGHNSAYIQEKLFISEGTAKTHIRHIYRKLNVHNQQELMRMIEGARISED